jgi:hypothetical protein
VALRQRKRHHQAVGPVPGIERLSLLCERRRSGQVMPIRVVHTVAAEPGVVGGVDDRAGWLTTSTVR